jgi:hypothetical protein
VDGDPARAAGPALEHVHPARAQALARWAAVLGLVLGGCSEASPSSASASGAPGASAAPDPSGVPTASAERGDDAERGDASAAPDDAALVREVESRLPRRSYLEERCEPRDPIAGVPAKRCRYRRMGHSLEVSLADIPRGTLAKWIVRAASDGAGSDGAAPASPAPTVRDTALALADFVVAQSSGAIPLDGQVWEDMAGDGVGELYAFDRGVSERSGTCRPMSLTAKEWCAGAADQAACARTDFHETCAGFVRDALRTGSHAGLAMRARRLRRR